jgi:hypothetical protein
MNTITNPSTTIFSNLMEKLFSLQPDKHLDYTYDYQIVCKNLYVDANFRPQILLHMN